MGIFGLRSGRKEPVPSFESFLFQYRPRPHHLQHRISGPFHQAGFGAVRLGRSVTRSPGLSHPSTDGQSLHFRDTGTQNDGDERPSLLNSLAKYPKVFPRTYTALVRGSEETGELQFVLNQLSEWLEKQDKLQRHVKKALTYPSFVIVLAALLTLILFKTVIPQLLETVVGLGAELPLPTKILLAVVWTVEQPLFWLLLVLAVAAVVWYFRTPKGYQQLLLASHYAPVIGGILTSAGAARYASTLSMLLKSGVDIIRACKIAADASGNPLLQQDSNRVLQSLREGQYLSEVLGARTYYPMILSDMIKVGDETGEMAKIINQCGQMLEDDTMHRIDMFMNLLEPIVLAAVSFIVGSVLIAVLMPMSNLISAL